MSSLFFLNSLPFIINCNNGSSLKKFNKYISNTINHTICSFVNGI